MRHFIDLLSFTTLELSRLLDLAARLKHDLGQGKRPALLPGKVLGLIFEKPSLRTRVSFEAAMAHLGGSNIFLSATDGPIGQRESIPDYARTMSQFVDGVVLRTFEHRTIEMFAEHATVPVINGLSDFNHPAQALADILTMQEVFGDLEGRTVVFVGDGNNVARSLAVGCARFGMHFVLAAPKEYGFPADFLNGYREAFGGKNPVQLTDPSEAVSQADVIYTDVWTSMGQEAETALRKKAFHGFQVNETLMAKAPAHAKFLHCLPAHRGEEVSAGVADGPQSVIFQQAGNRMHAQKAILVSLLGSGS
jgi:ornithine carbamoyltransferase